MSEAKATSANGNTTSDALGAVADTITGLSMRLAKLQQPGAGAASSNAQQQQLIAAVVKEFEDIASLLAASSHDTLLHADERTRYQQLLSQVRAILHTHRTAPGAAVGAGATEMTSVYPSAASAAAGAPAGGPPPLVATPDIIFAASARAFPNAAAPRAAEHPNSHDNGTAPAVAATANVAVADGRKDSLAMGSGADGGSKRVATDEYDDPDVVTDPETPKVAPVDEANVFGMLTYGWLNAIISRGRHSVLEARHLPPVPADDRTHNVARIWKRTWNEQQAGLPVDHKDNPARVVNTIWRIWHRFLFTSAIMEAIWVGCSFATPYIVKALIKYIVEGGDRGLGIGLAIALAATSEVNSLLINIKFYIMTRVGCVARSALINAIYEKALRLSSSAKQSSTMGETVNLMSNDTQRIYEAFPFMNTVWTSPVTIIICVVLLWQQIGISTLASVLLMFLLIPVQIIIGKKIGEIRRRMSKHTDERVKFMSEILQGVRVVKLYAWEESLAKVIYDIRERELMDIKVQGILKAVNMSLLFFWPVLVTMATFICYSLLDNVVNTANVFVVLAFLNVLRFPVILIPYAIATMVEGYVGAARIDRFLKLEEIDTRHRKVVDAPNHFLKMTDGEFRWAKQAQHPTLQGVNLQIAQGELVAVIGHVGVGKSSLFHALLGEMHCSKGNVEVCGRIAYMSQENWIRNTTLRNNILFGLPYDAARYEMVLEAAALKPDIAILADGDSTEIGERGVTLSGGQKARVSLARCVYRAALSDVYLLDDPLSAVDMNVGRQMMYNCVLGQLKGKTRVVILNSHLHFLPLFDKIVVVNNTASENRAGYIEAVGTYQELVPRFKDLMRADEGHDAEADEKHEGEKHIAKTKAKADAKAAEEAAAGGADAVRKQQEVKDEQQAKAAKKLIGEEDRVSGGVGGSVYVSYYDAASKGHGILLFVSLLLVMCVGQVARVFSDYWLTWWAADNDDGNPNHDSYYWHSSYVILVACTLFLLVIRGVVFALSAVDSSREMHALLFSNLLRAPTSTFFDVTPVGRVINRFSKDLDAVDIFLPDFTSQFIVNALQIISVVVLAVIATPWFLLILFPVVVLFWYVQMYFRISSREIKRLEGVTRSPVYSSFGETLTGVTTIRAYGMANEFMRNNRRVVDLNAKAFFMSYTSERWLAIRLDYLAATMVLTVSLLFVGLRDTIDPSLAGLSIIYSLQLMGFLQYTVRLSVMAENAFTSVERLLHYTNIPAERPYRIAETKPPAEWPTAGQITIKDLTMRYREDLPDVLKGVDLQLRPREKVGVCGRTGSGKSSLMVAFFRLVEARAGTIAIDGIDIGKIGLGDLRSKLSIIPQDPVLFSGPLRFNLDPFNHHDDAKIMTVLDRVRLGDFVRSLPTKLQHKVVEYGENFSQGQRQLICIARALLRESKILVMDEATAAIDTETDSAIQQTLRDNFKDCTVLTIAHRLDTIRDCDRILVMDQGKAAEFDSPDNLLAKDGGIFRSMVEQAGEAAAAKFRRGTQGGIAAAAAAAAEQAKLAAGINGAANGHANGNGNGHAATH